jgi:hypothetical protein
MGARWGELYKQIINCFNKAIQFSTSLHRCYTCNRPRRMDCSCRDIQRHNGLVETISHYFSQTFCAKALPAADLEALIVLPSLSIFDADGAAIADVFS